MDKPEAPAPENVPAVEGGQLGKQSYLSEMRARFVKWLRESPYKAAEKLRDWKTLVLIAGCVAYVYPCAYMWVIRSLPQSYYYVASLKDPAHDMKLDPWSIDVNWVDSGKRSDRLNKLLTLSGKIARLPKDAYIPAREDGTSATAEYLGRQWNGGQCLYISGVRLNAIRVNASGEVVKEEEHLPFTVDDKHPLAQEELLKQLPPDFSAHCEFAQVQACKTKALLDCDSGSKGKVCRAGVEQACKSDPPTKSCPALSIWLHGTPIPCFLL
jgi:hypothetical protein